MCGLSAVVDFASGAGLVDSLLAMHARIPHRGPDGEGLCVVDRDWRLVTAASPARLRERATIGARAGLAFRWLQIQDHDPVSAQPMASADGAIQLIFNGEIYNFRELRAELAALGRAFRSRSDTEVVLAAYERWGKGMFARLEGMWAIVVLDLRERALVISRDRFGIKPLFLHRDGSRLLLASEVKQLMAAGVAPAANLASVARFVRGGRPLPPEQTFFEAVEAQPPATYARIDLAGPSAAPNFEPYWQLEVGGAGADGPSLEQARAQLDGLLARSVSEHMVAAVPVGILVSGGLDSSLVAALSAGSYAARGERGGGYSMVPDGAASRLDESAHIDRVVAAFGLDGHAMRLTPRQLKEGIEGITRVQEEPVAGIAAAAQYMVFGLAARHGSRVVLDGQGADELFGGYPRHQIAYLGDCARRHRFAELLVQGAAMLARDRGLARDLWRGVVVPRARRALGAERKRGIDFLRPPHDRPLDPVPPASLGEVLRRDVLAGNLRAVLALTDRNSMAHSIEARVPYVHRPIVEFAFGLPDRLKVGAGARKRVLRAVGERHLPREIAWRRDRIGFGVPSQQWLARDFEPELRGLADGPAFREAAMVDRERLRAYVAAFLAGGHRDAGTIWRLYAVDQWARAYFVTGI